jgi:hypothetical protein
MDAQDGGGEWKDTQGPLRKADAGPAPRRKRRFTPHTRSWTTHPLTLSLALVIGVALAWVVTVSIVRWRAQVAAEHQMQVTQEAARQAELRVQQAQREAAEREEQRQTKLQQQEALKAQAFAARQQAEEDARRAEAAAADRKEKAWAKFYRRPAFCETAATMECVNGYIRARRSFEEKWNKAEF